MSEKLTFDEIGRDGAAVDHNERTGFTFARLVNGPDDELFARAALAADQHGSVGRRELPHQRERGFHLVGHADNIFEPVRRLKLVLQFLDPAFERHHLHGARNDDQKLVVVERLFEIIESPFLHGLHRGANLSMRRHNDRSTVGLALAPKDLHHLQSIHPGHFEVQQDHGRHELSIEFQSRLAGFGHLHFIAILSQQCGQNGTYARLIIDNQHLGFLHVSLLPTTGLSYRQGNPYFGSTPAGSLYPDFSIIPFDNTVANGQPETGAPRLGRKERIKNPLP